MPSLRPLFPIMWWAFALNFVTGVLLFMADATTKARQRVFYVKLALIALATCRHAWSVSRGLASRRTASMDGARSRRPFGTRGDSCRCVLWTAAIVAGRLLAYL